MTKKCKLCDYLNGFKNNTIKDYLNSKIVQNVNYKDFVAECQNNPVKSNIALPTKHYLDKHKIECLKDFQPIIKADVAKIVDEKEDKFVPVPDDFKDKNIFQHHQNFQEMFLQLLYVQTKIAVDLNYNVSKDQIKNIKDLYELAFKNCLDLSSFSVDFNNDKKELENAGLNVIKTIMSNCSISEKEALDIGKILLNNKLNSDVDTDNDNVELEQVTQLNKLIEYLSDNSKKQRLEEYLNNQQTMDFIKHEQD
jgi:hypothetical protein